MLYINRPSLVEYILIFGQRDADDISIMSQFQNVNVCEQFYGRVNRFQGVKEFFHSKNYVALIIDV